MSDGQIYRDDFMHVRLSMEEEERLARSELPAPAGSAPRPPVVCLCGSTRFVETYNEWRKRLTLEGKIVLAIEIVTSQSRDEDPQHTDPVLKQMLDELHLRKIDLADEILVLNVGGYIGKSTAREICYAAQQKKPIKLLEPFLLDKSRWLLDSTLAAKIAQEQNTKPTSDQTNSKVSESATKTEKP